MASGRDIRAADKRAPNEAPKDRLYGDMSPDDVDEGRQEEPEHEDKDASPDDFERGVSQPGVRDRQRKRE